MGMLAGRSRAGDRWLARLGGRSVSRWREREPMSPSSIDEVEREAKETLQAFRKHGVRGWAHAISVLDREGAAGAGQDPRNRGWTDRHSGQ